MKTNEEAGFFIKSIIENQVIESNTFHHNFIGRKPAVVASKEIFITFLQHNNILFNICNVQNSLCEVLK